MKKMTAVFISFLILILCCGTTIAEDGTFNPDVFQDSSLYKYDRYDNTWSLFALAEFNDDNTHVAFSFGTNANMSSMHQPFMFRVAAHYKQETYTPTAITFFLDDIRYDYKNLQFMSDNAIVNSGSVLRDMLNRLKDAEQISFRLYFTHDGENGHIDVDTDKKPYKDLIEVADLFEKANAWTIFAETTSMEALDKSNEAVRTPAIDTDAEDEDAPGVQPADDSAENPDGTGEQGLSDMPSPEGIKGMSEAELNELMSTVSAELASRKAESESRMAAETEELEALYHATVMRLALVNSGDLVYDENGIAVSWVGIQRDYSETQAGFICANTTGEDYQLIISNVLINGIAFPPYSNIRPVPLNNDTSYYTAS